MAGELTPERRLMSCSRNHEVGGSIPSIGTKMDNNEQIKKEMARWSSETRDRYYFELKINTFLKNEITRLEAEVLRLRNENKQMKVKMESMSIPKKQNVSVDNMLEID